METISIIIIFIALCIYGIAVSVERHSQLKELRGIRKEIKGFKK